jgi:hypothetical protein
MFKQQNYDMVQWQVNAFLRDSTVFFTDFLPKRCKTLIFTLFEEFGKMCRVCEPQLVGYFLYAHRGMSGVSLGLQHDSGEDHVFRAGTCFLGQ